MLGTCCLMLCRLTAKNQAFNSMNQASATQHTGWSVKPDPLCHLKNYAGHQAFYQLGHYFMMSKLLK